MNELHSIRVLELLLLGNGPLIEESESLRGTPSIYAFDGR